jgi:hypothetical protein
VRLRKKTEVKDELKKLGLRLRPRPAPSTRAATPGGIGPDGRLDENSDTGERLRGALTHPGLSIMEDEAPTNAPIRPNPKGLRLGYNPYESGMLAKPQRKRKVDLEQLSKVLELKRKLKDRPQE